MGIRKTAPIHKFLLNALIVSCGATSIFAIIPVVILLLCIEKHLVAGLTSGGVKG